MKKFRIFVIMGGLNVDIFHKAESREAALEYAKCYVTEKYPIELFRRYMIEEA